MNLPFDVTLRQKDAREAADCGLLLWRENFSLFIIFFAIPFWIIAFPLSLLPDRAFYISWAALWLLKPFFDRIILHIISIRFFEKKAGIKRLFKGLGKSIFRGLIGDLTWRRLSPLRSAMMPVRVLEPRRKVGKETAKRKNLLKEGGLNYCFFITLWGIALEMALLGGELLFFERITKIFSGNYFLGYGFFDNSKEILFALWCLNYILVETIYVCMGFSLYINSRINVEGWDIEIIFRNFVKNKKNICVLFIFCAFMLFTPAETPADDVPLESLQTILESPDFGGEKDTWGIRLKNPQEENKSPYNELYPFLEKLRLFFSSGLRIFLVLIIIALAVLLFIFVRKMVNERKIKEKKYSMSILQGINIKNPDELLEKALGFYKQENLRMAWGYCTAAAILSWPVYRSIEFPPNATENDCAQIINSCALGANCAPYEAENFSELINNWINFAYAGRMPPAESFEKAAAFCKSIKEING